jgi:glutathionylspermidine synthase
MHRRVCQPRHNWPEQLEGIGLTYHSVDGGYWREDAAYEFAESQIDELETATAALHQLCLDAVECIIVDDRFSDLQIADAWRPRIIDSWERQEASLYGRFDLWYDGRDTPKLLEYNADTPTALLEAAVGQWMWLQEVSPEADQFNSLHERLICRWSALRRQASTDLLHLVCLDESEEDRQNLIYLADTANQAGWRVQTLPVGQIGWDPVNRRFVDRLNEPIVMLFKLYPWEWLCQDEFASHLSASTMSVLEPAWKQLLSHKGLLALLWEWFPDHPNLLPASFKSFPGHNAYVRKPFWSREGANITIVNGAEVIKTDGPYGDLNAMVFQQYRPLPEFDGWHPVIGSWIIDEEPAGIGIREDRGLVHGNMSRFVPHRFWKEVSAL